MKTLKQLSASLLCLFLFGTCEQSVEDPSPIAEQQIGLQESKPDMKSKPFKARFYTKRTYNPDDVANVGVCDEGTYTALNLQVGGGNATHLGKFSTSLWFCGSTEDFTYANGKGEFIAANGDKLYFEIPSGEVMWLTEPNPPYELFFKDPFIFTGGTGRFEGASGGGNTDSLVDLLDDDGNLIEEHQTDHTWVGVLNLPKN